MLTDIGNEYPPWSMHHRTSSTWHLIRSKYVPFLSVWRSLSHSQTFAQADNKIIDCHLNLIHSTGRASFQVPTDFPFDSTYFHLKFNRISFCTRRYSQSVAFNVQHLCSNDFNYIVRTICGYFWLALVGQGNASSMAAKCSHGVHD